MGDGPRDGPRSAAAIGRSLRMYYGDADRTARMDALNAQFVPRGGLAFDLGAHVGDRTASFLRLGASVVALEPQPHVFRALRLIHGRSAQAVLRQEAVGAMSGRLDMQINSANPTVSSLSTEFVSAAEGAQGWQGQAWDRIVSVPVTTIDALIAFHGVPDFIKIDVEGHELEALKGLGQSVAALSFEFTTIQRSLVADCAARIDALGEFLYNFSLGEDHRLRCPDWVAAPQLIAMIDRLPDQANSGDIYARRR